MAASLRALRRLGTVAKGGSRAAVHGSRSPPTQSVDMEKVDEVISEGKEKKQMKQKEVEKKVKKEKSSSKD